MKDANDDDAVIEIKMSKRRLLDRYTWKRTNWFAFSLLWKFSDRYNLSIFTSLMSQCVRRKLHANYKFQCEFVC